MVVTAAQKSSEAFEGLAQALPQVVEVAWTSQAVEHTPRAVLEEVTV